MVAAAIKAVKVAAVNWDKIAKVAAWVATIAAATAEIAKEMKKKK